MDAAWKRKAGKQRYVVTTHLLQRLREIEYEVMQVIPPSRERRLQTRDTMPLRELREAALLCHGLATRFGETIGVTHWEEHDHDAVALIQKPGESCFYPLQMKQLPPDDLNPQASLQDIIDSLPAKYPRSPQLTVGISLNRNQHIDFHALSIPRMNIGGLFFFGASSPDQSEWILWGDVLSPGPFATFFTYPDVAPLASGPAGDKSAD